MILVHPAQPLFHVCSFAVCFLLPFCFFCLFTNTPNKTTPQKTGNAIRALGRMATLSASRRNSVASNAGSVLNSPRPSISGNSTFNATNMPAHMGSLHEEDDDFSIELPSTDMKRKNPKVLHKSQCSERSDSGYSECSNCSATGSVACQCATGKDSVDHIANDDLSSSVPHDLLKLKLEEIAHQADSNLEGVKLKVVVPSEKCLQLDDNQNELKTLRIAKTDERPVQIVEELDVLNKEITPSLTSPIMRSDFTNTIQMRKKSLENSLQKDKQLKPAAKCIRFEQPGKVNMLKNKFAHMQTQPQVSSSKSLAAAPFAKSKDCMDVLKFKRKLVVTEACPNQSNSIIINSCFYLDIRILISKLFLGFCAISFSSQLSFVVLIQPAYLTLGIAAKLSHTRA